MMRCCSAEQSIGLYSRGLVNERMERDFRTELDRLGVGSHGTHQQVRCPMLLQVAALLENRKNVAGP